MFQISVTIFYASLMIAHGSNSVEISEALGHSKISTTLDIYAHMFEGENKKIAAKMDNIIQQKKERVREE